MFFGIRRLFNEWNQSTPDINVNKNKVHKRNHTASPCSPFIECEEKMLFCHAHAYAYVICLLLPSSEHVSIYIVSTLLIGMGPIKPVQMNRTDVKNQMN